MFFFLIRRYALWWLSGINRNSHSPKIQTLFGLWHYMILLIFISTSLAKTHGQHTTSRCWNCFLIIITTTKTTTINTTHWFCIIIQLFEAENKQRKSKWFLIVCDLHECGSFVKKATGCLRIHFVQLTHA